MNAQVYANFVQNVVDSEKNGKTILKQKSSLPSNSIGMILFVFDIACVILGVILTGLGTSTDGSSVFKAGSTLIIIGILVLPIIFGIFMALTDGTAGSAQRYYEGSKFADEFKFDEDKDDEIIYSLIFCSMIKKENQARKIIQGNQNLELYREKAQEFKKLGDDLDLPEIKECNNKYQQAVVDANRELHQQIIDPYLKQLAPKLIGTDNVGIVPKHIREEMAKKIAKNM